MEGLQAYPLTVLPCSPGSVLERANAQNVSDWWLVSTQTCPEMPATSSSSPIDRPGLESATLRDGRGSRKGRGGLDTAICTSSLLSMLVWWADAEGTASLPDVPSVDASPRSEGNILPALLLQGLGAPAPLLQCSMSTVTSVGDSSRRTPKLLQVPAIACTTIYIIRNVLSCDIIVQHMRWVKRFTFATLLSTGGT